MSRALTAALTTIVIAVLAMPASASARTRSCGTVYFADGSRVHIEATRATSCTTVRRVMRRYMTSHAPCSGSGCYRRHFGWNCATAPWGAFPLLASCSRRGGYLAAYSFAD